MATPITRADLNIHINNIQCKQSDLGAALSTALSLGTCTWRELNDKNVSVTHMLNRIGCYKPFEGTVTYATKFAFAKVGTGSITVDLTIGAVTFTQFVGAGTATDIVNHFFNDINDNTTSPDYIAERVGNVLYVYSIDAGTDFAATTTVTIVDATGGTSVATTGLENDLDEILDLFNCLTFTEMCGIIRLTTKFADSTSDC